MLISSMCLNTEALRKRFLSLSLPPSSASHLHHASGPIPPNEEVQQRRGNRNHHLLDSRPL